MRDGVLRGAGYQRLIYQPAERPTEPMAMPRGAPAATFERNGGSLPSVAGATAGNAEGAMASDAPTLARWFRALCGGEIVSPASFAAMADFDRLPEYGLGLWDRRTEYGSASQALGHTGRAGDGYRTAAVCFGTPAMVVVVLANDGEHDVDTTVGNLWRAAGSG